MFIFESIGTSELILVGIVALIFLGPRKLPELARKFGKIMAEFRGTANEFKETWQREVNFEEAKALDLNTLEAETVSRADELNTQPPAEPMIKEIDPASFEHLVETDMQKPEREQGRNTQIEEQPTLSLDSDDPTHKKNWL